MRHVLAASWLRHGLDVVWRLLFLIVALAVLLVVTTRWNGWVGRKGWQETDDAYVQADTTPISVKVAGYLQSVPAQDFERVHQGQLLAHIVDDDYRALVAQAEAGVVSAKAHAQATLAQQGLQHATARAAASAVDAIAATLDQDNRDLAREQKLLKSGSSSTQAVEKLQAARAELTAKLAQARAEADAAKLQLDVLAAQASQSQAEIAAQQAALDLAKINLDYTRIVAPQDGVLGQRQARVGQYVTTGSLITTLVPLPNVWVIANFKETQITRMDVGQRAEISVDSFPGQVLHGHVAAFSPGSGSVFALLPPDNATGNFTKVVQRVAVKIVIDEPGKLGDRLIPGLSVIARVEALGARQP